MNFHRQHSLLLSLVAIASSARAEARVGCGDSTGARTNGIAALRSRDASHRSVPPDSVLFAAGPRFNVVAVSWGGPDVGFLVITDCHNSVIAVRNVGYVRRVSIIPPAATQRPPMVSIEHVTGTGTGWTREAQTLFVWDAGKLTMFWTGVTKEASYQAASVGSYEIEAVVSITSDSVIRAGRWFPLRAVLSNGQTRWVRDSTHDKLIHEGVALPRLRSH